MRRGIEEKNARHSSGWSVSTKVFSRIDIPRGAIGFLCMLTVCATLAAGLWPFHSPKNDVSWVEGKNAVRFGKYGTALSPGRLGLVSSGEVACSLEVWFEPALTWTTGSVVAFYDSPSAQQFSVQQDYTDLVLQLRSEKQNTWNGQRELRVDDIFRRRQAFVTITSDGLGTAVYIDGHLATRSPDFHLSINDLSGQLILANAPLRNRSWRGQLRGVAIYGSRLDPAQVVQHYQDWTQGGEPVIGQSERALAVYLFHEHGGRIIHNSIPTGADLNIPKEFLVVHQLLLEAPAEEFQTHRNYVRDAAMNIAGFVPLGFVLSLYFTAVRKMKYATIATIVAGAALSIAIEYLQAYLPTRYSGVTDLITNTAGTCLGVMLYRSSALFASKWRLEHFETGSRA